MLSDREKMVLHFCCTITIAKMTGIPHRDAIVEKMIEDVRTNRCRSMSTEEVTNLLEEINQEMMGGRNMFNYLLDNTLQRNPYSNDDRNDLR